MTFGEDFNLVASQFKEPKQDQDTPFGCDKEPRHRKLTDKNEGINLVCIRNDIMLKV